MKFDFFRRNTELICAIDKIRAGNLTIIIDLPVNFAESNKEST